jgi:hypothetical protein
VRQKHGVEEWRAKFVQRKYAFEEQEVQKGESEWMKVVYGFNGEHRYRRRSPFSSDDFRTRDITGYQRIHFQPCLWNQHYPIRAIGGKEEDHGTLLARGQGSRTQHFIGKPICPFLLPISLTSRHLGVRSSSRSPTRKWSTPCPSQILPLRKIRHP